MSIQFIFGGSGSGKTEYILREFLSNAPLDFRKSWFLIVPEQDTLSMSRRILDHPLNVGKGVLNIDVLSFKRLSYRVFEELNIGLPRIIDDLGKVMILRNVAGKIKEHLRLYKNQLDKPGFLSDLKSQISELYQYRVTPEMLSMCAEQTDSIFVKNKIIDLSMLYQSFREYMDEHSYMMEEELLDKLFEHLPDSGLLNNAMLAFDGFTGFTPSQQLVLEEMLPRVDKALFALDIRRGDVENIYEKRGPEDLFYLTRQTVFRITKLAEKTEVKILPHIDLNNFNAVNGEKRGGNEALPRFINSPMLDFLERNIYFNGNSIYKSYPSYPKSKYSDDYQGSIERNRQRQYSDHTSEISLWEAQDMREEIEYVASQIQALIRTKGIRYRDIGIILSDPESYRDIIYKVFYEAGIPYFFDDKGCLLDSPYAEFIRAALEVVNRNFSFESIMRYLRSLPLNTPEEENEVDLFENYLRLHGVRGRNAYNSKWDVYDELRIKLIDPLLSFAFKLSSGTTIPSISQRIDCLVEILNAAKVRERCLSLVTRLRDNGDQNRAEELEKGLDAIDEVLIRLKDLLGDAVVSREVFKDILDAGLSEASIKVIPSTLDELTIGDLTRSRFDNPDIFFICGANLGLIPKAEADQKIIGDRERELFRALDIELAPDRTENALIQRFYIYRALLNPSDKLFISYPLKGRNGKSLRPSALIGDLKRLFNPLLKVHIIKDEVREIYTKKQALSFISRHLQDIIRDKDTNDNDNNYYKHLFLSCLLALSNNIDSKDNDLRDKDSNDKDIKDKVLKSIDIKDEYLKDTADSAIHRSLNNILHAAGFHYEENSLSNETAGLLYGNVITGSITRLEQFASCAFAHFLKYGLKLSERESYELMPFDFGNIYHSSIENAFRSLMERREKLSDLKREELFYLAEESVNRTSENEFTRMTETARNRYLLSRITSITYTTLWALSKQLERGSFVPDEIETGFTLSKPGLNLRGRIDRIDISRFEDKLYLKILDYKSGSTAFDLNKIYEGLQLQLFTYLSLARENYSIRFPALEVLPAALLYYHIRDPLLDFKMSLSESDIERERLKLLKPDGIVSADPAALLQLDKEIEGTKGESLVIPASFKDGMANLNKKSIATPDRFKLLERHVDRVLRHHAGEIRRGKIMIRPVKENNTLSACSYCLFHAVCQFDSRIDGYRYHLLGKRKPEGIWKKLEEEYYNPKLNGNK